MLFLFITTAFAAPVSVTVVDATTGKSIQYASYIVMTLWQPSALPALSRYIDCNTGVIPLGLSRRIWQSDSTHHRQSDVPPYGFDWSLHLSSSWKMNSKRGYHRHVVTSEEQKRVPGTFGDPVRALQSLPGVARPNIGRCDRCSRRWRYQRRFLCRWHAGSYVPHDGWSLGHHPLLHRRHRIFGWHAIKLWWSYSSRCQCSNQYGNRRTKVNMRVDFWTVDWHWNRRSMISGSPRCGRYSWVGGWATYW